MSASASASSTDSEDSEDSYTVPLHKPKFLKKTVYTKNSGSVSTPEQNDEKSQQDLREKIRQINERLDTLEYNGLSMAGGGGSSNEQHILKLLKLDDSDTGNAHEKKLWEERHAVRIQAVRRNYVAKQLEVERREAQRLKRETQGTLKRSEDDEDDQVLWEFSKKSHRMSRVRGF